MIGNLSPKTPACVAAAAKILGDKWTPMIIRALTICPARFCALQQLSGGVNPRTLSAKLVRLEEEGIIIKNTVSEFPHHTEYCLTLKGNDLLPILEQMAQWGNKYGPKSDS